MSKLTLKSIKEFAAEHNLAQLTVVAFDGTNTAIVSCGATTADTKAAAADVEKVKAALEHDGNDSKQQLLDKIAQLTEVINRPNYVYVLERIEHDGYGNKQPDGYLVFKTEKQAQHYLGAAVSARGSKTLEAGDFTYKHIGNRIAVPDVVIEIALKSSNMLHMTNLDLLLINDPEGGYAAKEKKGPTKFRAKPGPKSYISLDELYA